MTDSTQLDPAAVKAAAEWKQGDRCPWCGNASLFVHMQGRPCSGEMTLLCDACDVLWDTESAKRWIEVQEPDRSKGDG